jgi:hypothetical protein
MLHDTLLPHGSGHTSQALNAAVVILNVPDEPGTAVSMSPHHPPVRLQLRLPLREGGVGLHATGVPVKDVMDQQRVTPLLATSFLPAAASIHDAIPDGQTPVLAPSLCSHH